MTRLARRHDTVLLSHGTYMAVSDHIRAQCVDAIRASSSDIVAVYEYIGESDSTGHTISSKSTIFAVSRATSMCIEGKYDTAVSILKRYNMQLMSKCVQYLWEKAETCRVEAPSQNSRLLNKVHFLDNM